MDKLGETIKSIGKLALVAGRPMLLAKSGAKAVPGKPLIILGNGPSLRQTIDTRLSLLQKTPCMAVNFAANTPEFRQIKPMYYILVDPHFFSAPDDPNVSLLWRNLAAVTWQMVLIVPIQQQAKAYQSMSGAGKNVGISSVNTTGVEGFTWLTDFLYKIGRGMPRPRNVLVPAIMSGIWMGYKDIYLVGADHSWLQTISVNDNNEVVSVQPHYYKEDDKEVKRIRTEYLKYPLHQILGSFQTAFRSYHQLQAWALKRGVHIYNATAGSFIDAFPRKTI